VVTFLEKHGYFFRKYGLYFGKKVVNADHCSCCCCCGGAAAAAEAMTTQTVAVAVADRRCHGS
jgi:hypothetical protein